MATNHIDILLTRTSKGTMRGKMQLASGLEREGGDLVVHMSGQFRVVSLNIRQLFFSFFFTRAGPFFPWSFVCAVVHILDGWFQKPYLTFSE
jgi:hypothetical protein